MVFLTDENVAKPVVAGLRQAGYIIIDVKENGWHGKSDKQLSAYAERKNAIIITHDKDFLQQLNHAVILLRFTNQQPNNVIKYLLSFLSSVVFKKKLRKKVVVILSEANAEFHYI